MNYFRSRLEPRGCDKINRCACRLRKSRRDARCFTDAQDQHQNRKKKQNKNETDERKTKQKTRTKQFVFGICEGTLFSQSSNRCLAVGWVRKRNLQEKTSRRVPVLSSVPTVLCRMKITNSPNTSCAHPLHVSLGLVDVYCALEVVDVVTRFCRTHCSTGM